MAARYAYLLWKDIGKPRLGVVYDVTRHAKSNFKNVLRVCKNHKTSLLRIKLLVKSMQKMIGISGGISKTPQTVVLNFLTLWVMYMTDKA